MVKKLVFLKPLQNPVEPREIKQSVTSKDLYNNFYTTVDLIKTKMNSKENKSKIFESSSIGKNRWLIFMIISIFILITVNPVLDKGVLWFFTILPFMVIFPRIWIYNNNW